MKNLVATPSSFRTIALLALLFAGCGTTESRIRQNPALFAQLSPEQQQMIRTGKIAIGFTADMVRLALGVPDRVQVTQDLPSTAEVWTYSTNAGLWRDSYRVIFRKGIVAAIETDSKRRD
jgi:hypothetical protein